MYCYCSICRKTGGGSGSAINLSADAASLEVEGKKNLTVYQARLDSEDGEGGETSPAERNFCSRCGSALWVWDPRWPELLHPFASAIDSVLPKAPERCHIMLDFKPKWVPLSSGKRDSQFRGYPDQSIHDWHQSRGLISYEAAERLPRGGRLVVAAFKRTRILWQGGYSRWKSYVRRLGGQ